MCSCDHIGTALFERIWKHYLTDDIAINLFNKIVPEAYRDEIQDEKDSDNFPQYLKNKDISLQPIVDWLEDLFERILPSISVKDGLVYDSDSEIRDIFWEVCRQTYLRKNLSYYESIQKSKNFSG